MFKCKSLVATIAAGLLLQSSAFAGLNSSSTVWVSDGAAYGAFHDARYNSGSTENISCYIGAYVTTYTSTTTSNYLQCSATAADGASYYCYVYNPPQTWVEMISALNESSWLYFRGDASHHCLSFSTQPGSNYL